MGLCKCPKKKVTNQFCFEHRVNVCEHCMVTNHPKCIVQSYLQWLQDSDYNPICELCKSELALGDCIRLVCYHVFHLDCLNRHAASLPPYTAPDGYACPSCNVSLFPPDNVASPVADHVKQVLSSASWARLAMGMTATSPATEQKIHDAQIDARAENDKQAAVTTSTWPVSNSAAVASSLPQNIYQTVSVPTSAAQYREQPMMFSGAVAPRKVYEAMDDEFLPPPHDHDENKYKRRSALEWLARWFKSHVQVKGRHDPHRRFKRCAIIAVLIVLGFLTLIMIFSRLGRASADDDPFLNPMANPHIRVGQEPLVTD